MFNVQFDKYACIGDAIAYTIGKFEFIARIEHDSDSTPNDFDCYDECDIERWKKDEWFFVGVVLSCKYNGIALECNESLWGIECNMGENNNYLMEVANDLLAQFDHEKARLDLVASLS